MNILKKLKSCSPVFHQSYQSETKITFDEKNEKGYAIIREGSFSFDLRKVALFGAAFAAFLYCVHTAKR